ncbi:MAG: hypothetical protein E7665_03725 [Ruminococcaceae bacterium]|nr:hypothetical protein [Oscillospiraceae bacterium]
MKCNFKTSVRIFSAFMAVLLLFSALSLQVIADTTIEEDKDTYKDLENQLAEIRRSKNNITASIAEAKNKKDSAIEVKNLLDRELYLIGEEISTINLLIAEYEGRVLEIENEIMALEEEMYASYNKLMDRLVVIYENGDAELIDFLLSSGNFAEFLSRIEYTTDLISFNKGILDKLQMDKDELEAKKMLRESAADSVADMLEKSIESEQELIEKSKAAADLIAAYEKDVVKYEQLERESQQDMQDIESMLKALAEQIKDKEAELYAGGLMRWPLDKDYYITSPRGWRTHPVTGEKETYHRGIDIGTNGSKVNVYAAGNGTVIYASEKGTYGNCIMIDHGVDEKGRSIVTLYAHLSKITTKVGTKVKAGDKIGNVGDTGRANGIHLHLEVRVDGVDVEPSEYVNVKAKER